MGGRAGRRRVRAWSVLAVAAPMAGLWVVACQDGTSPSYVDDIRLLPDSAHVPVGESFDFRIAVFDQRDDSLPDRVSRVQLVNLNPEVVDAEVDGSLLHVTTLQAGKAVIDMRLGFGQGRAQVFVPPVRVARIEIEPSPIALDNGGRVEVEAKLFDADGDVLPPEGHRISWDMRVLEGPNILGVSFTDIGPVCSLRAATFAQVPQTRMLVLIVDGLKVETTVTVQ